MMFTLVSVIVVCFVLCLVSDKDYGRTDGSSTTVLYWHGDSVDDGSLPSTNTGTDLSDHSSVCDYVEDVDVVNCVDEGAYDGSVSTLEDVIIYIMPNTIDVLTEMFNELPHKVVPTKYGWTA